MIQNTCTINFAATLMSNQKNYLSCLEHVLLFLVTIETMTAADSEQKSAAVIYFLLEEIYNYIYMKVDYQTY